MASHLTICTPSASVSEGAAGKHLGHFQLKKQASLILKIYFIQFAHSNFTSIFLSYLTWVSKCVSRHESIVISSFHNDQKKKFNIGCACVWANKLNIEHQRNIFMNKAQCVFSNLRSQWLVTLQLTAGVGNYFNSGATLRRRRSAEGRTF